MRIVSFFATGFIIAISFFHLSHLTAKVIEIKEEKEFNNLIESKKPIVLKFFAEYCPPCKLTKEPFEHVSDENEFQSIAFVELDIQSPAAEVIAKNYRILGVPTIIFVSDGNEIDRIVGLEDLRTFKDGLRERLRKNFSVTPTEESEEISDIEMEEEIAIPEPFKEEPQKDIGVLTQLWFSIQAFFSFIIEKLKDVFLYIINLIKGIFGK